MYIVEVFHRTDTPDLDTGRYTDTTDSTVMYTALAAGADQASWEAMWPNLEWVGDESPEAVAKFVGTLGAKRFDVYRGV